MAHSNQFFPWSGVNAKLLIRRCCLNLEINNNILGLFVCFFFEIIKQEKRGMKVLENVIILKIKYNLLGEKHYILIMT